MSYRLTPLPEDREPEAVMFDVARQSYITVDNGTISRINIPCFYGRRLTRQDKMIFDHMGWPAVDRPDRSDYAQALAINDIDLEDEGYTGVNVILSPTAPTGLSMSGELDYNHIVLVVSAMCNDAITDDIDTKFAIYVTGSNPEVGTLKDLVTKGTIRILAGNV